MEKVIEGCAHIPVTMAAQELATTHLRVLMFVKEGILQGAVVDGEWYVSRASVDSFSAHGLDVRPQDTCRTSCAASSCGCRGK